MDEKGQYTSLENSFIETSKSYGIAIFTVDHFVRITVLNDRGGRIYALEKRTHILLVAALAQTMSAAKRNPFK